MHSEEKCDFTSISDFYEVNTASDNVIQTKIPEIPVTKAINKSSWGPFSVDWYHVADPGCAEHLGITDLPPNWNFPICVGHKCQFHPSGKQQ